MLKTLFKSIYRNKLVFIFLIIEFTIMIYLSLDVIETYQITYARPNAIKKLFDAKSILVVRYKVDTKNLKNMVEFSDKVDSIKSVAEVKKVGYCRVQDYSTTSSLEGIKHYIFVNDDMMDIYNVKDSNGNIINGNIFRKYDYQNKTKPALTGALLKADGKNFDVSYEAKLLNTYKSIIILKKDYPYGYINDDTLNLNNCVILPFPDTNEDNMSLKLNAVANGFFIKVNPEDINKAKKDIREFYKSEGFSIDVFTMEDDIHNWVKDSEEYFIAQLRITICLAIFSVMGTAVVLLLSINGRKREFGVRMATGASKFYLLKLVYGEVMLSIVISYIIALLYYSGHNVMIERALGENAFQLFNPWFSIRYLLCVFTVILILSFSVVRIILKMQPRDLFGGAK